MRLTQRSALAEVSLGIQAIETNFEGKPIEDF
jgi:hypothetical protein